MAIALAIIGVCVVAVGAAQLAKHVRHPEQTADHDLVPPDTTSERFYRLVDRPAGPDAEDPIIEPHTTRPPER